MILKADKKNKDEDKDKDKDKDKDGGLSEKLLRSRTILLSRPVDDKLVESIATQLFIMQNESATDPIYVYINSPGGSADSGFALFDLLTFIEPTVVTICSGICASAAVMIYLGGDAGLRVSLPNSRFLLHQPSTQAQGTASDLQITAQEILKLRQRYNEIVARETGKSAKKVTEDSARDFWMDPVEANNYGLVNHIVKSRADLQKLLG